MLLQKPLCKNDVVTIKLIGGEELIARFEDQNEKHLIVSKVSVVAANPQGMGLIPWIMSAEADKVELNKALIATFLPTTKEIADKFTELTTSIKLV
jgi:hypothetical protein